MLVEGDSDRVAVETLARRLGLDLAGEGVGVVSIGGSKNITTYLERLGPRGLGLRLAGLCDQAQEGDFQRGLERAGFGSDLRRADLERLGFFVCVADLEDELIRSLGAAAVERVIDAEGELASYRTFQKQPQWRGSGDAEQLRRFLGTHKGRKVRSAARLVDALDLDRVPRPLEGVLAYALVRSSH